MLNYSVVVTYGLDNYIVCGFMDINFLHVLVAE